MSKSANTTFSMFCKTKTLVMVHQKKNVRPLLLLVKLM